LNASATSPLNLPRALRPGDTLGIVAPASAFDRRLFDAGIRVLESMGFKLLIPVEIFAKSGYLAGSDRQRADLIGRLFADPDVDGLICARGGYGTMRILPLLDADLIAAHPKIFVGFSDITALLSFLVVRCRMTAFHGPTVTTLGSAEKATRDQFLSVLTDPAALTLHAAAPHALQAGRASGRFFCGNLTLFAHLTGTPFQPDFDGCVLLVEDRGEAPYRIDRMLTQMRLAGCFDHLAGLALGSFTDCGSTDEVHRIFIDRLGDLKLPILAGFAVGHGQGNRTLPVGAAVLLDADAGTLSFGESAVSRR
jgi:muramoyltetrapeptide carboxypeptidase